MEKLIRSARRTRSRHPVKLLKNTIFFVLLAMFFYLIYFLIDQREDFENCWANSKENCGFNRTIEYLDLTSNDSSLQSPSIMLLEGHFNDHLTPRMLCSVESAALAHPQQAVNVLLTSRQLRLTPLTKSVMSSYANVRFLHLDTSKVFLNSYMEEWFAQEKWKTSSWPKSHFNDALRWLLLWKYGGIYLDLDVVVLRNLMEETNFAGLESEDWVGAGALRFDKEHPFVRECLKEMALHFNGKVWGSNGPELLTNMLRKLCKMQLPSGNLLGCADIKVYSTKAFYPIPWWEWSKYLENNEEFSEKLLADPEVLAIHVWNLHTHRHPVFLRESSPYAIAARRFCPVVVNGVGHIF